MHATFPAVLRRYQENLQTVPWLSLIGYGVLVIMYGGLVSLFLPAGWQRPFIRFLLVLPLLFIVAKDLASFPLALQRLRRSSARGESLLQRLAEILPPELRLYPRLERAIWQGFFSWALRRQHSARPAGTPLAYLERGSYGSVIGIVLLAVLVEMPLDVLIASVMARTPAQAHTLHLVFGALALYSLVWVLGDRWHVRSRGQHILTVTTLELDIGPRGSGSIPLDAIASCALLKESRKEWCQRHAYQFYATRKLTPLDAPNLVLQLHPGCDVRLTLLQLERGGDGPIFLYLDRPEMLCAELAKLFPPARKP